MIGHRMRVGMRAVVAAVALGAAGVLGIPGLLHHSPAGTPGGGSGPTFGVAPAAAAPAAVTPKTEAPNEARALSRAFSNVAKALGPSVVRIEVEVARGGMGGGRHRVQPPGGQDDDDNNDGNVPPFFRHFFDFNGGGMPDPGPAHGVGSGFIIGTNGDIITNRHVVQGSSKVTVTMNDGKEYAAQVVGKDAQTDVAVVRLEKPPANLVVARL